jgi:hypothetical protein
LVLPSSVLFLERALISVIKKGVKFLPLMLFNFAFSTDLFIQFSGKLVNVIVEEDSELTRGETVVDWLGVTNRKPNCFVMDKADDKKFFQLLKNKFATLP